MSERKCAECGGKYLIHGKNIPQPIYCCEECFEEAMRKIEE